MTARGTLSPPPLELDLFTNMYLAGTIIFGGGPVVIPLLREYVVEPGWVSSRDFLLGLAIIQAFPGPNFNCTLPNSSSSLPKLTSLKVAVYLGALTLSSSTITNTDSSVGALLGFLGIFLPGLTLAIGVQSIWRVLRSKPLVVSLLRGVNATAVGLVFTAVYRLWEIGYLKGANGGGSGSLGEEPWWVVVVGITYSVVMWWRVPPAVAILGGAAAGVAWWGVVR
jgi:chromate transport protein ChrA